jgi:hypothetical protein
MTPLAEACTRALAAIEADPLALPPEAAAHLLRCPGCSEAQVAWLAQAEAEPFEAPAGYFQHLPGRILGKLPPRPRSAAGRPLLWAAAALLAAGLGTGGFLLGLGRRAPVVEATLALPAHETYEILPDTPFLEADEDPGPPAGADAPQPAIEHRDGRP